MEGKLCRRGLARYYHKLKRLNLIDQAYNLLLCRVQVAIDVVEELLKHVWRLAKFGSNRIQQRSNYIAQLQAAKNSRRRHAAEKTHWIKAAVGVDLERAL